MNKYYHLLLKKAFNFYRIPLTNPEYVRLKTSSPDEILNNEKVKNYISFCKKIISDYVYSNLYLSAYIRLINGSMQYFDGYLNTVKLVDSDLYNKYLFVTNKNEKKLHDVVENTKSDLISHLEYGMGERNFDIIDFYLMFEVDPLEYYKELRKNELINREYIKKSSKFLKKSIGKDFSTKDINDFINFDYSILGKKLDYDSKVLIIKFLKENNIPINHCTRSAICKRYIENTIDISNGGKIYVK